MTDLTRGVIVKTKSHSPPRSLSDGHTESQWPFSNTVYQAMSRWCEDNCQEEYDSVHLGGFAPLCYWKFFFQSTDELAMFKLVWAEHVNHGAVVVRNYA